MLSYYDGHGVEMVRKKLPKQNLVIYLGEAHIAKCKDLEFALNSFLFLRFSRNLRKVPLISKIRSRVFEL